jgi:hypothetical protein
MSKPFQTTPIQLKRNQETVYCGICSATATTNALFQLEGCIVVQKYCDKCLLDAEYEVPV